MNFNIDRLTALLNLTRSDNDHEALIAIRMANRMLGDRGSWEQLIKPGSPSSPLRQPASEGEVDIDLMFDTVLEGSLSDRARGFVESLEENYNKWGRLTPKQHAALKKFYETERR